MKSETIINKDKQRTAREYAKVPKGRLSRLGQLGSLATRVAGSMVTEGVKQLAQGNRPKASELLLTPSNAKRVAEQLAQLRGAAMKVGQLLSMDAGDLLPPELSELLARLRAEAKAMPISQLNAVLQEEWELDWQDRFQTFSFYPVAAASIGQVHSATNLDGKKIALKIQYPGIKESIDSDVDNVATLLRVSGLLPKDVDYQDLLEEAKKQLHAEADYLLEASLLKQYQQHLAPDSRYLIPDVFDELTTENILAMQFVDGLPVETLTDQPQHVRDLVMELAFELLFKEMFEFKLVQTDPNFANFLFNAQTQQLVLLDFGATRAYPAHVADGYQQLLSAALYHNKTSMNDALRQIGFFSQPITPSQQDAVIELCLEACEPIMTDGEFDFGQTDLARRIRDAGTALSMKENYWHTPPADAIFFHRKLGGLYLLAARLKARVNVREIFSPYLLSPAST
ncbi:ABC1 kinase family protein [Photobacterium lutimaris]|uniref:Ubiquinol-cytochrome C reductase n=1 Tax=Photobacterium lutimaris TaxID=388278 RepID=A0A2T3J1T5_9GAMM|nr:AarF/ABC1/UbiB kinase family protein [Photobacterium lutimaris]PSU35045.1 ubiquinol-cytochrome C reductase [Photobacterium lutimaris]TDR77403.1 putative unusual protein kinase regulating ubiquinone biosynthesis (AarF/ABC1/UbiB family) [Photobacterium lutimaris]